MFTKPPPLAAALHLSLTLDALRLADEAFGVTLAALGESESEYQCPIDSYDVSGFHATCRLFLALFAPAKQVLGSRDVYPRMCAIIAEQVQAQGDSPGNPPGLERAGLAVAFAVAALGDAVVAFVDEGACDDEWYSPCVAAHDLLEMIQVAIDSGRVRGRGPGAFDRGFFGSN
jgi:hypothetical protein